MSQAIIESHYLPSVQYFSIIKNFSKVYIDHSERYTKQSYRNRSRILTVNKVMDLTIPVKIKKIGIESSEVKIDYTQRWAHQHLGAIQAAYGRAPFFEYYFNLFEDILLKKHDRLVDINKEIMTLCLHLTGLDTECCFIENKKDDNETIEKLFNTVSRKENIDHIEFKEYPQVFGKKFVKNLSIADLLFNEGQNSIAYL